MRAAAKEATRLTSTHSDWMPLDVLRHELTERGVRLVYADLPDDVSGLLKVYRGVVTIGVNVGHPLARQRFTIAHELYHLIAGHAHGLSLLSDSPLPEERAADRFAAVLLMPAWRVRRIIAQGGGPSEVARELGVSLEAARKRIEELT